MGGRAGDGASLGFSLARGMELPPRLCSSRTISCCPWGSGEGEQVQSRPKHSSGPRGGHKCPPALAGGWLEPPEKWHLQCPAPQVGLLQDAQLKSPWQWGAWPRGQLPSPSPGTWAAEPRSGCSSNGFIPAEAGSKAGADLDGVLLNNGEGTCSLLLLATETCVFQSISFWE